MRLMRTVLGSVAVLVAVSLGASPVLAAAPDGPAAHPGGVAFVVPATVASGGVLPAAITTADVNGDGRTDVVAANEGPAAFAGGVGVALGNGNGGLSAPVTTSLPQDWGACSIAAARLDGDGMADAVVLGCTTGGSGPLFVLRSSGGGAMAVAQQIQNHADGQVGLGDVTGDGQADLIFSASGSAQVRLYLGRGDGTFGAPVVSSPPFGSFAIAVDDVTGDGRADLVGAGGGPLWVMPATAGGILGAQVTSPVQAFGLALGDLDGNGTIDAATGDASGGHVFVASGVGDGTFTLARTFDDVAAQTQWLAIGDVDADGVPDVVSNSGQTNAAVVFAGKGGLAFRAPIRLLTGASGLRTAHLDGAPGDDLVAFSSDPGRIYATVARRGGLRTATIDPRGLLGVPGDLEGDGDLDVVWAATTLHSGIQSVIVARVNQGGSFGPPVSTLIRAEQAGSGATSVAVADLNDDGFLDVAGGISNLFPSPNNLFVALGDGTGGFSTPVQYSSGDVDADIQSVALVDVTGDGHADLVSHTRTQVSVLPGAGGTSFGAPIVSGSAGFVQVATLVGDVTGDGVLDEISVLRTGSEDVGIGEVRVNAGSGDGHFAHVQTLGFDGNATGGVPADLDGDGTLDVATTGVQGSDGGRTGVRVFLNDGAGALQQGVYYARGGSGLTVADLDLDGDLDLTTDGIGATEINLNAGDGSFAAMTTIPAAGGVAITADMTGDGAPDIVAGNAVVVNRTSA